MRRYKEGISVLVFQTLFCDETSGGVAKCRRLFSKAFAGTFSGPKKNPVISFFIFCSTTPLLYHTDLRTEAHVPTLWYDQYLTVRAHNHVTLVVAARAAVSSLLVFTRPQARCLTCYYRPRRSRAKKGKSTDLIASFTLGKW